MGRPLGSREPKLRPEPLLFLSLVRCQSPIKAPVVSVENSLQLKPVTRCHAFFAYCYYFLTDHLSPSFGKQ
jgi:hypothetical protein